MASANTAEDRPLSAPGKWQKPSTRNVVKVLEDCHWWCLPVSMSLQCTSGLSRSLCCTIARLSILSPPAPFFSEKDPQLLYRNVNLRATININDTTIYIQFCPHWRPPPNHEVTRECRWSRRQTINPLQRRWGASLTWPTPTPSQGKTRISMRKTTLPCKILEFQLIKN